MPPKKVTGAAAQAKEAKEKKPAAAAPAHGSYKDMIKEAIVSLKERNGSSRQAVKKYVKANNSITVNSEAQFDSLFNRALKSGVDNGDFSQPKGPSGPVKLAKKEAKPVEKKPAAAKKEKAPKKEEAKEAKPKAKATKAKGPGRPKGSTTATKAKKVTTAKKPAAAKPKANTATKRAPKAKAKTEAPAPAVTDVPVVLKKTASGRISKQKATTGTTKAAPKKKAAAKKATPKKSATPKKAEAEA